MIFEFYWSWYEDYCLHLLEHSNKTKKEFEADCKKAMVECFDNYMKDLDEWASVCDWIEEACKKLVEYGYTFIKPICFGFFGGYIVKEREREDENFKEFPEQMKQMIEYNEKFDKELYEDMYKEHPELVDSNK